MKKATQETVRRTRGRGTSIGGFEFADSSTRWRIRAAIINSKAANDEANHAWRVAA